MYSHYPTLWEHVTILEPSDINSLLLKQNFLLKLAQAKGPVYQMTQARSGLPSGHKILILLEEVPKVTQLLLCLVRCLPVRVRWEIVTAGK